MKPGPVPVPRILAGAPALDRRAFPRPGSVPRWFEPFHVRQPQVARGEVAAQVAAGADVVVAPAWLTHRRALEAVGESRRAQAWTVAAVRLAREAIEVGLERREGPLGGPSPGDLLGPADAPTLVAGPLPDVSARSEQATGRRLPAAASEERDTHDQAGILADAAVDLLLLEPRVSHEACLRSTRTAAETGLPVWVVIPASDAPDAPPIAERVEAIVASGASGVLVDVGPSGAPGLAAETLGRLVEDASAALGAVSDGPPLAAAADLDAWLRAGVSALGIASGADPEAIAPLVSARERLLGEARQRLDADRDSLAAWVGDAAARAPGGRALWLGATEAPLPSGFDWTVLDPDDATLGALPAEAFRLVVALTDADPRALGRLVERGGIVALRTGRTDGIEALELLAAAGLTPQDVERTTGGARLIARREDR